MEISIDSVKELRDATGVSIMQCKKALEEAGGDFEKAKLILRKLSSNAASKKADRQLGSGVVASYVHGTGNIGAMVTLLCETDFVAKNEDFKALARDIAMHVVASAPSYLCEEQIGEEEKNKAREVFEEEAKGKPENIKEQIVSGKLDAYFKEKVLLSQSFIKNPDQTISDLVKGAIQKFGEKVEIGRFVRFGVVE